MKISKRAVLWACCALCMVLAGCSSTKSATMFDASVPMKEQCIIVNDSGINIKTIDGSPVKSLGEVYIPSGTHELLIGVNATRTISYQRWNISGEVTFTRDFEAGHVYKIQIKFNKNAAEPRSAYGITFYHEGDLEVWAEIEDITSGYKDDPIPVALGAPHSGALTNWDRPAGFYLQSAGSVGAYLSYHNVTEFGDWDWIKNADTDNNPQPDNKSQIDSFHAGAGGLYFQMGFETGYKKFGFAVLGDLAAGLGVDGEYYGVVMDGEIGLMGMLYYDKTIGIGLGGGTWTTLPPYFMAPYYRAMLSFYPGASFTHDLSFYFDYFPKDAIWGAGIRWAPYLRGQPISGNAKTLR